MYRKGYEKVRNKLSKVIMELKKLTIESYKSSDYSGHILQTIDLYINPESYSQNYNPIYKNPDVIGDPEQTLFFAGMGSNTLALNKLIVDGTGVVQPKLNVEDYITKLGEVLYKYNGDMHRPPYVKIRWGKLVFNGVCTSFQVNYTLFKPDGTALRAFVDLEFKNSVNFETKEKRANNNSPDLTHVRTVKAGDTLPLMTYQIYGDSSYYLEVARVNGLNNINCLKPGSQVFFPPLKK